jgi:hypothetical protein
MPFEARSLGLLLPKSRIRIEGHAKRLQERKRPLGKDLFFPKQVADVSQDTSIFPDGIGEGQRLSDRRHMYFPDVLYIMSWRA